LEGAGLSMSNCAFRLDVQAPVILENVEVKEE